jgi:hypothetical protein
VRHRLKILARLAEHGDFVPQPFADRGESGDRGDRARRAI